MDARALAWAAILAIALAGTAAAGGARVLDGDTLELPDGERVRLLNIDAPESGQDCTDARGRIYDCGARATAALRRIVGDAPLHCEAEGRDQYGRLLARCFADGADIGRRMVQAGHAVAYLQFSDEYLDDQLDAFKSGKGLWAGSFMEPAEFRRTRWQTPDSAAPDADCPIKGNISAQGERIYHVPWSRSYGRTRIDEARGERWFCDEEEALAAGWRAPFGN